MTISSQDSLSDKLDIKVSAQTHYQLDHSDPSEQRFVFSYTITIQNNSDASVKLLSRNWLITDANGETVNVQGEGVIGQKPTIAPDKHYTYTSGAALKTPVGSMQGHYQMMTHDGDLIQIDIPVFSLAVPNIIH